MEDIDLSQKLFTNVSEQVLRKANAAIENAYVNEAGGHTRFPGLAAFVTLTGNQPTYLHEWQGDLIAESGSRLWRIDSQGVASDVTGTPVPGSMRTIFDSTDNELVMAKGGAIIRLGSDTTEILSADAPEATHVAYIDSYLMANEMNSGRFNHSGSDDFRTWDPLDVFAVNAKPDDVNAMTVTPYREIILTGPKSIEQYERLAQGSTPFIRRWAVGEGITAPYTLVNADQGTFVVNAKKEFVRLSGQTSEPRSDDIGKTLSDVDDWTLAWAAPMVLLGQKFILLQAPYATNPHGTQGLTFLHDYRSKKWASLYGFADGEPQRWPGWSYYPMWGRHFVGGDGKVLELDENTFTSDGQVQKMLGRTAHIDRWGSSEISNVRMRLKRGSGTDADNPPVISLRARKDNRKVTNWKQRSLGVAGQSELMLDFGNFGAAYTWQFEWFVTDEVPVEIVTLQAEVHPLGAI